MSLTIIDRNKVLSEEAREFVERRLQFALSRFGAKIRNISVVLSDENGPRGGIDKACCITVELHRAQDVIIKDQDASIEACVARAAERLRRAVTRSLDRTRSFDRFSATDVESTLPPDTSLEEAT